MRRRGVLGWLAAWAAAGARAQSAESLAPADAQAELPSDAPEDRAPERLTPMPEPEGPWVERGDASWYGRRFHGRRTANGERYDMRKHTAAHPSLPFGTRVQVRSLRNGRTVVVRINDRGPHTPGRIIDLSQAAAQELGLVGVGVKEVEVTVLDAPEGEASVAAGPGN